MQILPAVPSFILFSRSGAIIRSIPSYFDQIPVKELFVNSHIFFILDQCFGDIWKHQQIKLFNEYYRLDEQTLRLSTIERSIREYISTGRISRRPPFPMGEYLPPMYGLKDWRFLESQSIFGLSPFPITPETTSWKILNIQNAIATVKRQILYGRTLNQHRLVIREILRRLLKNFNSLNLPKGNIDEIQDKNTETLLIKLTYILMCTITKPISTIQRNIEEDFAKRMYFLFKQSRIVFQEQIGIKQKFSISFKDDETVDGVLPPAQPKSCISIKLIFKHVE
ncbi:MAG: hypothetical protein EZS28_005608 [Streblomastix strix]|uniref:Uncharacterized protein n=1 Tax=Streblomastix strix TaxID=222440 RepID=A0A5J4WWE8_9EUKA|nr:MAG: hypothetical protein EZS28_005608 [Streblomastix strix]